MPLLVPDAAGAGPQLQRCRGAPHPAVLPGRPRGECGPRSRGSRHREARLPQWPSEPTPLSYCPSLAVLTSLPPAPGALGQSRTLWAMALEPGRVWGSASCPCLLHLKSSPASSHTQAQTLQLLHLSALFTEHLLGPGPHQEPLLLGTTQTGLGR